MGRAWGQADRGPEATMVSKDGALAPWSFIERSISAATASSEIPGLILRTAAVQTSLISRADWRMRASSSASLTARSRSTRSKAATQRTRGPAAVCSAVFWATVSCAGEKPRRRVPRQRFRASPAARSSPCAAMETEAS